LLSNRTVTLRSETVSEADVALCVVPPNPVPAQISR
jgi:hypothetical protein